MELNLFFWGGRGFQKQVRNLTAATCAHLLQHMSGTWRPTCDRTRARNHTSVSFALSAAAIAVTCHTIVGDATNSCQ